MESDLDDIVALISENKTRKRLIDPILKQRGWYKTYIKEEVNSVRSDFAAKRFFYFEGDCQKGIDRFI
jgi:type I site-specific restriction endonuclease